MKTEISVFPWAKIGQNDHSNPYIESTTVLSDILLYSRAHKKIHFLHARVPCELLPRNAYVLKVRRALSST